jgi:quercetin dioxygenase-like cupin family protein
MKHSISSYQIFNDRRFTKQNMFKSADCTVFILNFLPGQIMPAHYHPGAELHFHVLQGNGTFTIDGSNIEVTADEVVYCEGTKKVSFTNTGNNNVSIYVTLSKVSSEGNGDIEKSETC